MGSIHREGANRYSRHNFEGNALHRTVSFLFYYSFCMVNILSARQSSDDVEEPTPTEDIFIVFSASMLLTSLLPRRRSRLKIILYRTMNLRTFYIAMDSRAPTMILVISEELRYHGTTVRPMWLYVARLSMGPSLYDSNVSRYLECL
jgi:hypothetical protein